MIRDHDIESKNDLGGPEVGADLAMVVDDVDRRPGKFLADVVVVLLPDMLRMSQDNEHIGHEFALSLFRTWMHFLPARLGLGTSRSFALRIGKDTHCQGLCSHGSGWPSAASSAAGRRSAARRNALG